MMRASFPSLLEVSKAHFLTAVSDIQVPTAVCTKHLHCESTLHLRYALQYPLLRFASTAEAEESTRWGAGRVGRAPAGLL